MPNDERKLAALVMVLCSNKMEITLEDARLAARLWLKGRQTDGKQASTDD